MLNTLFCHLLHAGARHFDRNGHHWLAALLFKATGNAGSYDFAKALWTDGRSREARQAVEILLASEPAHADGQNLLGVILLDAGNLNAAEQCFQRALLARPYFAVAHANQGNVHLRRNETGAAIECYRTALSYDPLYVEALTNLGGALDISGHHAEAERVCRKAIDIQPGYAGAYCNLGNSLLSQERLGEAVAAYRAALHHQPGLPEALICLALALGDAEYLIGVVDHYKKILEQAPGYCLAHLRLAQAYQAMDRWEEADRYLEQALSIEPMNLDALALSGKNHGQSGDRVTGISYYRKVLENGPQSGVHSNLAFDLQYLPNFPAEAVRKEFEVWAKCYGRDGTHDLPSVPQKIPGRPIRIAYVSHDFCRHSVAYFVEPFLAHHDHGRFSIYCYSTRLHPDSVTDRIQALADVWRDVSLLSINELVCQIRQDEIDILVDLGGHTYGNRLTAFANKPAPIQVSMIGQPATTGFSAIDWRIVDHVTDPPGMTEMHYTEQLCRLPDCFLTYLPAADSPDVAPPPVIDKTSITFGSFNNVAKINVQVVKVWAEILCRVPKSTLLLKGFAFSSLSARQRILDLFGCQGINPERIELLAWHPETQHHLELYSRIDIALDPFPYNGTTTTCEALWMGVPVVCIAGDRHASRVGASLLSCLGLETLLAETEEAYIQIAVELALNPGRLQSLRSVLRDTMRASLLLDHAAYTRNLEATFMAMIEVPSRPSPSPPVPPAVALPIPTGVHIRLPDTLNVISRFVIEERGDWFESEISFVRRFLQPGMRVLDVGANYGVYALSVAAAVGINGRVWAFEPDPLVAALLRESAALNGFAQLVVIEQAVADAEGTATLDISGGSELNHLVVSGDGLAVALTTLDGCREAFGCRDIDFIKIDAEGQEPAVVRGGQTLLTTDMPLVMAEFKHGTEINVTMFEEFGRLGFSPYVFVPGLGLLVPYDIESTPDAFLLNLFFCTNARAVQLAQRGLLCREYMTADTLPVCASDVLECHARAQRIDLSPGARLSALGAALNGAERLAADPQATLIDRLNLARVLADSGQRQRACIEYEAILARLHQGERVPADLCSCLLPSGEQEMPAEKDDLLAWLIAATADWLYFNVAFSAFFAPADCMRLLNAILATSYRGEKAQRLKRLILRRWYGDSLLVNGELDRLIGTD